MKIAMFSTYMSDVFTSSKLFTPKSPRVCRNVRFTTVACEIMRTVLLFLNIKSQPRSGQNVFSQQFSGPTTLLGVVARLFSM